MSPLQRRSVGVGLVVVGLLGIGAIVAVLLGGRFAAQNVGTIDGHPVTRDEVVFHMSLLRRDVQNRIQTAAAAGATWDWELQVDGRSARQVLVDEALAQLATDKQVFLLATELGLLDSADHQGFLRRLEAENSRREQAARNGQIVYGLTEFSAQEYYSSTLSELRTSIVQALAAQPESGFEVTEADIRGRYESEPDAWTAGVASYGVLRLAVPISASDPAQRAEQLSEVAVATVDAATLRELADAYPGVTLSDELVEGADPNSVVGPRREALSQLALLEIGDRTSPIETEGEFVVYELTGKEVDTQQALVAYSGRIREAILADRFEALIAERVRTSDVNVDQTVMQTIEMEEVKQ